MTIARFAALNLSACICPLFLAGAEEEGNTPMEEARHTGPHGQSPPIAAQSTTLTSTACAWPSHVCPHCSVTLVPPTLSPACSGILTAQHLLGKDAECLVHLQEKPPALYN